jgi:hypothetical protein
MTSTVYFECDRCRIECKVDAVSGPNNIPFTIRHCADSKGIPLEGRVIAFQERRGGLWMEVEHGHRIKRAS